ncbi:hypothetical protein SAMN05444008_108153 [Cnuella takakiae]|uniref:Universal stress protein family protein n=1 Tax=Cnuella takakiae TaxID=1302690 RepID=A0A1M5BZH8_9BACT|nr:hypothetical protein [Cnuella takakiae]OLY94943.1 hypothetical protein BUE76_18030 [Cnuella takakiae]SHF47602.1 hypothetical protein SAMN05444008_108153 [Cnuella takakiae]
MKKIILAFDGIMFSEGAFAFARRMNELAPVLVVGVFVPQVSYAGMWSYGVVAGAPSYLPLQETETGDIIRQNIQRFETLCQENGMRSHVHKDFFDFALPELLRETRFADLLVISSEQFYQHLGDEPASDYMRELLTKAECPVVIVPEDVCFPTKTILAYDGSASSVYAVKQFAYLFRELSLNETLLVFMKEDADEKFPEEHNIMELASEHFPMLELFKLDINPRKYFNQWVLENKDAILVSGAFSRSIFSQLLRKSFITDVIAEHKLPVFIAHR